MEHNFYVQKICVKNYLHHMRFIDNDFKALEGRIASIENQLTLMGVSFDKIGYTSLSEGDKMGSGLIDLLEARDKLAERNARYRRYYEQACDLCEPHNLYRYALWLHYVDGHNWDTVGSKLGYSESHIKFLAAKGITELYSLMPEEYRRYTLPNAAPF